MARSSNEDPNTIDQPYISVQDIFPISSSSLFREEDLEELRQANKFVNNTPLGSSLQGFIEPLRRAMNRENAEIECQQCIVLVLHALGTIALPLNFDLSDEIANLKRLVHYNGFRHDDYLPLIQLVVNGKPDPEVWREIYRLIELASRVETQGTNKGTRVTLSTAFLHGAGQKKSMLYRQLLEELRPWTYRDVKGFFEKYFDKATWAHEANDIYRKMKQNGEYINGVLEAFSRLPTEEEVWEWYDKFQKQYLSKATRQYYRTEHARELKGGEWPRQVDLFVASNINSAEATSKWTSVMVVGKLKQTKDDGFQDTFIQLAIYARKVFSAQPSRRFVHGFTLCEYEMEAWVFDRSGAYSPGVFNIHEHPERFIKIIAGYCLMSEEELGVDTFMTHTSDQCSIAFEKWNKHMCFTDLAPPMWNSASAMNVDILMDPKILFRQRAIVSRGTTCYATKVPAGNRYDCVTKFSWVSQKRQSEADLHKLVLERNVKGVVKLVAHCDLTSIEALRSGLVFDKPPYFARGQNQAGQSYDNGRWKRPGLVSSQDSASKRSRTSTSQANISRNETTKAQGADDSEDELYDNRVLRCLVLSPAGKPLYQYDTPLELVQAMRGAIKAHQSLYHKGRILHRDISENNIIITDASANNKFKGMLIDLDLAKQVGDDASGSHHCTGTSAFMAIGTLRDRTHTYRHDLESFFYVLLWQCARRGWDYEKRREKVKGKKPQKEEKPPKYSVLTGWCTGDFRAIANCKEQCLHHSAFEDLLEEFPSSLEVVKQLCRDFRQILFNPGRIRRDRVGLGTPKDSKKLYKKIIRAFEKSIKTIKKK